jgi:hypothetical protein
MITTSQSQELDMITIFRCNIAKTIFEVTYLIEAPRIYPTPTPKEFILPELSTLLPG